MKIKLEYIWLDGTQPAAQIRSKTKVVSSEAFTGELEDLPVWSFDGSSTMQAEGGDSDCLLKPVRIYEDHGRKNGYLILCEVMDPDGTPHASNTRAQFEDVEDLWLGFEQEYVLKDHGSPLGFPEQGFPAPQGKYYCGVGAGRVEGRGVVEEHLDTCLEAGIHITGINAEVMIGQWEFQVFGKGAKRAADDLLISRYLLERTTEQFGVQVDFHPKPIAGDWNGSGMHTNFSTREMREIGGKEMMYDICEQFRAYHEEHIHSYGADNELRLTGQHETQHIGTFSYGVSDRSASIRIPVSVPADSWRGYLEDRRPASNADPYIVAARIARTLAAIHQRTEAVAMV